MAFLPQRNYVEQTLANNYNLGNGLTAFTSVNIAEYNKISFQINTTGLSGSNRFTIEQSSDNVNWIPINDTVYNLDSGSGTLTIQKNDFSGKYIRIDLIDAGNGTLTIILIAKR